MAVLGDGMRQGGVENFVLGPRNGECAVDLIPIVVALSLLGSTDKDTP